MGTGYTRNDTPNNIADGNVINASDLDGEFDAIQAAFNNSTGHSHDGTTGEGPQIDTGGIADSAVTTAKINNDAVTLGTKTSGNYVATGAVSGVGLSGSASSEGATFTVTSNATDANTASTIVARDASGDFSAGTITAALTGTASNAALLDSLDSTQFLRSDAADTKTSGDLSFSDNVKAVFGAGSDLQIYHNGSASVISDVGTGNFFISGDNDVFISKADLSEVKAKFSTNGAVTLYYDNAEKLATTATGVDVTGTITFDGGTTSADLNFGDNDKAIFGAGSDLQIYHDGSNSYIYDAGTGSLGIHATNLNLKDATGAETYATFVKDGAATLYYDNAAKIATTSGGIDVTGTVTADGLTVDGNATLQSAAPSMFLKDTDFTDTYGQILQTGSVTNLRLREDTADGSFRISGYGGAVTTERLRVKNNGDIAFYADNGTTEGLLWDASTQRLGLGTTSPAVNFHISSTGTPTLRIQDADGSDYYAQISQATGNTIFDARFGASNGAFIFRGLGGGVADEYLRIDSSGNVLVGKTSEDATTVGSTMRPNGGIVSVRDGDTNVVLNRKTSDGTIIDLRKDGTTVGSIGANADSLFIASPYGSDSGLRIGNSNVSPATTAGAARDAAIDLGYSSDRFKDLYLSGALTNDGTGGINIDTSGNVGIGNPAPASPLDIKPQINSATLPNTPANHSITIQPPTTTGNYGGGIGWCEGGAVNTAASINAVDAGTGAALHLAFATGSNASIAERVRITTDGNVGIGTSSPNAKLMVSHGNNAPNSSGNMTSGSVFSNSGTLSALQVGSTSNYSYLNSAYSNNSGVGVDLRFYIGGGSERMRIHSGTGRLLVGTTNASPHNISSGTVGGCSFGEDNGGEIASDAYNVFQVNKLSSTSGSLIAFRYNATQTGYISTNGTTTAYNTSSDYRLKENVADMTGAIDRVKSLAPKRFNFIADADTTVDGFLAHEAQAVVPESVTGTHNEVDEDGNPVMQGIDQSKLVPLLTGALQEAIAKIETLEARLTALEGA